MENNTSTKYLCISDKYKHLNHVDAQFLTLMEDILINGEEDENRTGINTKSLFRRSMRFDLQKGFPLQTTRKMWFKAIAYELFWMMGLHQYDEKYSSLGVTNIKYLIDNDIHIWDEWGVKKWLASIKSPIKPYTPEWDLAKEEYSNKIKTDINFAKEYGDMGRIYGYQWRSFTGVTVERTPPVFKTLEKSDLKMKLLQNRSLTNIKTYYFDQLVDVIKKLITDPTNRRIKIGSWNPVDFNHTDVALPCCHYDLTFKSTKGENGKRVLNLSFELRSSDFFIAANWNTAFYALLQHIIAKMTNHEIGELVYNATDVHLYMDHIDAVKDQLAQCNFVHDSPQLTLADDFPIVDSNTDNLDAAIETALSKIDMAMIKLVGYASAKTIKAPIAV